ncbi:glycoside hydrolase family 97 protein [Zobellia roscoffensis]|uniref:glycoside hydrolase family 97 protein n=2 Tax=Zobellia roscoffensis TaxID=2779508 RepID=UPI001D059158|nr:glycoside hydrolase family 97 protein [Zobellia roscoffensis]
MQKAFKIMFYIFRNTNCNLKKIGLSFFSVVLLFINQVAGQEFTLKSPAGNNEVQIRIGDNISYRVLHKGEEVLSFSPISITINGMQLGENPKIKKQNSVTVDRVIEPVVRVKRAEIVENYNQLNLTFKGNFGVRFRAYNDGVAYRIETTLKKDAQVDEEELVYNFPENFKGNFPISDGFFSHQERTSFQYSLDGLPQKEMSCLPVLMHVNNGVKLAITEADLYDYPGFYLKKGDGNSLKAVFPYYPLKTIRPRDRDVKVVEREPFMAKTQGKRTYPWRLMVISDDDTELIENELVYLLSREQNEIDMDWVKPGKASWDWYNANNVYGVDFKSGFNTETYKYYIDFASRSNIEYIIIDEGWYDIETGDLLNPVDAIRMEELIQYGKEKGVGIILWVTWKALEDQFEDAMDKFQSWDIKGIKVDFMKRDDQWMVNYYEKVARGAAKRKLLVDFHGSYKPSGLRRAYPNVITSEGVLGLEQNKGSTLANPENNLIIPFTRMLAGPMDYTPGAMANAQKENHSPIFERPMSLGTRCHQLAMFVVYESPLQMLADTPSRYLKETEAMEFLSVVPTVWDKTIALDAQFSDYIVVARKSGDDWYVGAMTDWTARDLEIDFSFLNEGSYTMTLYQDGVNANRFAEDYKRLELEVTPSDKKTIHLAPGGGWVARIVRK